MAGTDVPRWERAWCVWNVQGDNSSWKRRSLERESGRKQDQRNSQKPDHHGLSPSMHGLWCPSLKCVQRDEFKTD